MLSLSIMAHPARRKIAVKLAHTLNAPIVWDQINDRWDTGRRAWLEHDPTASHHLVIQDDALVQPHFLYHVQNAISHAPPGVLSLYAGHTWRDVFKEIPPGVSFLQMKQIVWGVGIVMPVSLIRRVIAYADGIDPEKVHHHYDLRLSRYFQSRRLPVYYTWPSLVEHRNGPSLIPGRNGGRHAYRMIKRTERPSWEGEVYKC